MVPNLNDIFEAQLAKLNQQQREAVETTEGPVLVLAGPGTGKTQILAARIGYILQQTDSNPENILCLTYTDAGTIAMRQRLVEFIGPDAYRISIHTFHSFCNSIIKENIELFGTKELDAISDLEKIELIHELIDGFDKDSPLKRWTGDVYYDTYRLSKLFDIMKAEHFSAEMIHQKIDEYLLELPTREAFQYKRANAKKNIAVGDIKVNDIAKEESKMKELRAAVSAFATFEKLMQSRGRYDYHDMILWVLQAFKTNENLLRRYQEKYLYILVDEYQDTNGSQNEILLELVSFWDEPNVFVVGDDDQSIYRFQGASIDNILDYTKHFPGTKQIVLSENYRSSQVILDASKTLIEQNKERLVNHDTTLTKNLIAQNKEVATLATLPTIYSFDNDLHEWVYIANQIEMAWSKKESLNETAILYRNHKQCEEITKYLTVKNIPFQIKRKYNILDTIFTNKLLKILEYIEGEIRFPFSREDLLYEILHFDFFAINPFEIGKIALHIRTNNEFKNIRSYLNELKIPTQQANLFEIEKGNESLIAAKKVSVFLETSIRGIHNFTLQGLFENILTQGTVLSYVMNHQDRVDLLQELNTLFDFIKEETSKNPATKIKDLLNTIRLMKENNIRLEVSKSIGKKEGVQFITVHSAKGLEFKKVFIIGCDNDNWMKSSINRTFAFPDTIYQKKHEGDEGEEERRLFYVAMTRAKQELIISYAIHNNKGKEKEKSMYVSELEKFASVSSVHQVLSTDLLVEASILSRTEVASSILPLIDRDAVLKILEKYQLSVTSLNNYLKCPRGFYFNNILRIPSAKKAAMEFGSAVHEAIYFFFLNMTETNEFGSSEELVQLFVREMKKRLDGFTDIEYEQKLAYGKDFLPKYFDAHIGAWKKIVALERRINNVVVDGVPIKGVLDKIEFDGSNGSVVDYKTGKYDNAKKKFNRPEELYKDPESPTFEEQYGGDYWRQAVFYRILIDNYKDKDWKIISTVFEFMEPDRKTGDFYSEKIVITEEDIKIVKNQMSSSYTKIMNMEFDQGCDEDECHWCNFVKSNFVSMDMTMLAEEQKNQLEDA
jgi:DNA helicase-2/ATP-dependent DNA helicase PcrA